MQSWLDASNPEQTDLSRPDECKFGLGLARSFSVLRDRALAGRRQGLNHGGLFRVGLVASSFLGSQASWSRDLLVENA